MPKRRNIGKKKGSRRKQAKNQNKSVEKIPKTRFLPGDRVSCCLQDKTWKDGQITQLWWRSSTWPNGQKVPYQVRLDNGQMIFVPFDTSELIKPGPEQKLRFGVGAPVVCKISTNPDVWCPGHVIAHHYPLPRNPRVRMPYQILLDKDESDKGLIFAPVDDDNYVKFAVDGSPLTQEAKERFTLPSKRRFKVGDLVQCKTGVDPEVWEVGEVKGVNLVHPLNTKLTLPYKVYILSQGQMIFAPADTEEVIKKHDGPRPEKRKGLRFSIGDRVTCKISRTEQLWVTGTIIDVNIKQKNVVLPYQIQLDGSKKRIYAPIDHENIIRSIDKHVKTQGPKTVEIAIPNLDIEKIRGMEKVKGVVKTQLYDANEADNIDLPNANETSLEAAKESVEKSKKVEEAAQEGPEFDDNIAEAIEPEINEKKPLLDRHGTEKLRRGKGDPTTILNPDSKESEENQSMVSGLFKFLSLD